MFYLYPFETMACIFFSSTFDKCSSRVDLKKLFQKQSAMRDFFSSVAILLFPVVFLLVPGWFVTVL